jgi:aminoglycoside phosphotransferase (APT) family kinase protein
VSHDDDLATCVAPGVEPGVAPDIEPGVDLERLAAWMDAQGLPRGPIERCERLGGGTQNILLRFERGGCAYVLRRPPLHKRENSDETMRREARVLAALRGSTIPHPRLVAACAETHVLGASFTLMEAVRGFNPTAGLPALHASDPRIRRRMGLALADAIAALGEIDHLAVGLADFGRPEGYLERQVARWRRQLEGYGALPGYPGPRIPGLDEVAAWLERNRPGRLRPGILHGDTHLGNVLYESDGPELAALVDWELATIGDPLLDLGQLLVTWPGEEGSLGPSVQPWEGFPSAAELVARYRERSTRSLDLLVWYEVLACYRLGIILEGTHARACAGKADRAIGDALHATALALFARASRRIRAS